MPSDLTPVLRKVHDAWAKLKAARRAGARADSAKSDAAGKHEQKVKEMAAAAVSGGAQFQKARFEDQINALMARKIKADSDSVDASKVVKKAEQVLAQANSEYHQKLLQLVFEK